MAVSFQETHQRYQAALDSALHHFKRLVDSHHSKHWQPVPPNSTQPHHPLSQFSQTQQANAYQFLNGLAPIDFSNVQVHRRKLDGSSVVRAISDLSIDPTRFDIDDFKAVLQTAEIRGVWDKLVDKATVIEMLDPQTRIVKTDFRLGWPANPRDSITISKTFTDSNTVIDISTSLPRSADEPAYLRPSPPFVRSHVHLLAWCIQLIHDPPQPSNNPSQSSQSKEAEQTHDPITDRDSSTPTLLNKPPPSKARITVFWKVNWKGAIFSTHHSQIASLLNGFVDYVRNQATEIPIMSSYADGVDFSSASYNKADEKLNLSYSILPEDSASNSSELVRDAPENEKISFDRAQLQRAIELKLPVDQGWDIQVNVIGQGEDVDENWEVMAEKPPDALRTILRITHAKLPNPDQLVKVNVIVQRLAGGKTVRVNQTPVKAATVEPSSNDLLSNIFKDDARSISELSLLTGSTEKSKLTHDSNSTLEAPARESASPCPQASVLAKKLNASRENVISTLLRRSYIYFSSLLQEPDAKWKHTSDSRGVSVTQLQSIDPTLTVYRAEATFVGLGVWNVLSAITTPGARLYWDKSLTEVKLLEELNDLSSLWQIKQKGSWPIAPRDSILITTTYKSPASVHIFSVSTDDSNLFPRIQPPTPGYIRARTEILGWSIESLSPTTTQITLIDQHDPLGWSPKSWTPAQLIAQVANVGEFALKSGGPPLITRISGARVTSSKYEHDKGTFRAEYTASENALTPAIMDPSHSTTCLIDSSDTSSVECEIRCDCESWAVSLDIVVDPPPTKASCLKRHKLSSGGGWWITIEHDANLLEHDKAKILIRRGRTGPDDKGSVTLNGTSLKIDTEELSAGEARSLATQRRVKASLIPLDQYSLPGPRTWRGSPSVSNPGTRSSTPNPGRGQEDECPAPVADGTSLHPIANLLTPSEPLRPSHPMTSALEALAVLQTFHIEQGPDIMVPPTGWTLVAEKGSTSVYKKRVPQISETFPVYRADQVIQGVTAEEMVSVLATFSSRPLWDDGVEASHLLESYGNGCTTRLLTTKPTFPFKARLLQTANVHALLQIPSTSISSSTTTVHFLASASFKQPGDGLLTNSKLNPQGLIEAHMFLEGWIMETVDPYSSSSHEIPSTRCTHFSAIDYGSSLPVALNSILNSSLPRMINGLATLVKSHGPVPRLCQPVFGLRMNSSLRTDGLAEWKWKLDGADNSKIALSVDATPDSPFRAMFLLQKGANEPASNVSPTASGGPSSAHSTSRYETIRQLGVSFPSTSDSSGGSTFVRRLVSTPDLHRKASTGQLRRTGASWTSNLHGAHVISPKANELIVAELALDRKFYPHGCQVSWKACFLKSGSKAVIERDINFPFPPEADTLMLPLKVSFHQMPSPTIFAASLDPAVRREHMLLRMTLPVGEIHSPIKDPLTSHSDLEPSPPPLWYTRMSKRAVVLYLSIEQVAVKKESDATGPPHEPSKGIKKSQDFQAIVNGEEKKVIPIEESQAELERREVDDYMGVYPSISRVGRLSSTLPKRQVSHPTPSHSVVEGILPPEMEQPLATLIDFKSDLDDNPGSSSLPGSAMESPHLLSPVNEVREPEEEGGKQNLIHGSHDLEVESTNRPQNGSFEAFKNFIFRSQNNKHTKNNNTTTSNTLQANQPTGFLRQFIFRRRTFTNRHVVLTALISFLLGSILRSMLIPSDYLIIPPSPPPSSMPCSSYPPSSSAILSTTTTLNEDTKNNQHGDRDHHVNDFCATRNGQHQGYFRFSESDKQLLRLLETRNHWKQLRKIFDFNLSVFSYFFYSSWSIIIAFVKN